MACDRTILVPDATAIVQDQDGNELARENIASGATGIIPVNVGGGVLYTYPYDSFNTGQDVSYATGDDKEIRDTVFAPEIAAQEASGLLLVYPRLSQTDPTKLAWGSNPDGSGTNIFGNLERFTDENGNKWTENATVYIIDHLTGQSLYVDRGTIPTNNFINSISYANNLTFNTKTDWHTPNRKQIILSGLYNGYRNLLVGNLSSGLWCSTTNSQDSSFGFIFQNNDSNTNSALNNFAKTTTTGQILFRKAFTYNPTTKQMDLI